MKRLTMQIKLLPLVAAALLLLNGCSLIGLAVGSQDQASKTYQIDEIGRVVIDESGRVVRDYTLRGKTVIISLNDGTDVRGKYAGLTLNGEGALLLTLQRADTDGRGLSLLTTYAGFTSPGRKMRCWSVF